MGSRLTFPAALILLSWAHCWPIASGHICQAQENAAKPAAGDVLPVPPAPFKARSTCGRRTRSPTSRNR